LRAQLVVGESRLWNELRNRQLGGFKFVRQAAIGSYFADFACREKKLIVEVDGGTHGLETEIAADACNAWGIACFALRTRMWPAIWRVSSTQFCMNLRRWGRAAAPHPDALPAGGERGFEADLLLGYEGREMTSRRFE